MIPVARVAEPKGFDERVRQRGAAWLAKNGPSTRELPGYWREFADDLRRGFEDRCAYTALFTSGGDVDHYLPASAHPALAYEWSNYRYSDGRFNSSKGAKPILDPYEVGEGWFELVLPTFVLQATGRVPPSHRALVEATLDEHHLRDGRRHVEMRLSWYRRHRRDGLPLPSLRRFAPMVAAAIERWLASGRALPDL